MGKGLYSILAAACAVMVCGCNADLEKTAAETNRKVDKIVTRAVDAAPTDYDVQVSPFEDSKDAEQAAVVSGEVTLADAVRLALANNRAYRAERDKMYLSALSLIDARHLYEPNVLMGGATAYDRTGPGDPLTGDQEETESYATAAMQQLLASGAAVAADVSLGWVDVLSGDYSSGFYSVFNATITQPLLRGAGREIALESLTQAQRNTVYEVRSFNRYSDLFVAQIASEYFRILADAEILANSEAYNASLNEMYAQLEKRAKAGLLPRHELEQAYQDIIDSQAKHNEALMAYQNRLDDFKLLLALSPESDITLSATELDAVRKALENPLEITIDRAVEMALWQRGDLINSSDAIRDAERKVHVAEDALRAELNVAGFAGGRSLDGKTASENYRLSLELDLPIDRTTEKTLWQASLLSLVQAQRDYAELEDNAAAEARRGVRDMALTRERYEIETRGCELARKRSDSTALLLQYDRANTRDLLDAKEDLIDAQDSANDAMSDYISATLRLLADTGSLKLNAQGKPNLALSSAE